MFIGDQFAHVLFWGFEEVVEAWWGVLVIDVDYFHAVKLFSSFDFCFVLLDGSDVGGFKDIVGEDVKLSFSQPLNFDHSDAQVWELFSEIVAFVGHKDDIDFFFD